MHFGAVLGLVDLEIWAAIVLFLMGFGYGLRGVCNVWAIGLGQGDSDESVSLDSTGLDAVVGGDVIREGALVYSSNASQWLESDSESVDLKPKLFSSGSLRNRTNLFSEPGYYVPIYHLYFIGKH